MNDMDNGRDYAAGIRAARKLRSFVMRLLFAGAAVALLGVLVGFALMQNPDKTAGMKQAVFVLVLGVGTGVALQLFSWLWRLAGYRCPRCRGYLGHGWRFPNFCPGCGLDIREQ